MRWTARSGERECRSRSRLCEMQGIGTLIAGGRGGPLLSSCGSAGAARNGRPSRTPRQSTRRGLPALDPALCDTLRFRLRPAPRHSA